MLRSALQGNKHFKSLHLAMLSKNKYKAIHKGNVKKEPRSNSRFLTIIYDREYVIKYLQKKVVTPLGNQSLETLISLLTEAYTKAKGRDENADLPDIDDDE